MRLHLADLIDIAARHVFESAIDWGMPIETGGLQTVYGLISTKMSSQGSIEQDIAFRAMH
jgi:polyphosphate kinase